MTPRWLPAAAAVLVCGWGGNQFTPLLGLYREAGYSPVVVDGLLGAYVIGLAPALLVLGGLAERVGRRPVVLLGVLASLVSSLCLAAGPLGLGWLVAGRLVTGVGVASAMAVGTTWVRELTDLDLRTPGDLGVRRGAAWLTVGLGLGPGVAGVLAQWGPDPEVLPYLVHAVLCAPVLLLVLRGRETRGRGTVREASATVFLPGGLRRVAWVVVPLAPWVFGSLGVAYAVLPQLVGDRLGSLGLAYSTLLTVCALGAGVLVQRVAHRLDRPHDARAALVALAVVCGGLVAAVLAAVLVSPWVALGAATVLGAGYGLALLAGLLELRRAVAPAALARVTGWYYALAYVGFLLPAVMALASGAVGYVAMLAILVGVAVAALLTVRVRSTSPLAPVADRV
ncbi:MFS transporter [Rhodococcus aerolatus]